MNEPKTLKTAFRFAVVEDDAISRQILINMIHFLAPEATLSWEAEDGATALANLKEAPPDVLFLDIEFPSGGAFELLETSKTQKLSLPKIVFVTGKDEHALKAFDWEACDYLMKPLDPARVQETIERVCKTLASPDIESLLDYVRKMVKADQPERFSVFFRNRLRLFKWSEILYLHTELRQVYAHTFQDKIPIEQKMDDLEVLLRGRFARIHRSTLINLDYLVEVIIPHSQTGQVIMPNGARLNVSRERMGDLVSMIKKITQKPQ